MARAVKVAYIEHSCFTGISLLNTVIYSIQYRFLNERKEASQNTEIGASLKRKRDATEISNGRVNDDGSALKKVKNFSIMDSFSGIANKAAAALNMAFSVLFGWKNTTSSQLVANVRQETGETLAAPTHDLENISRTEESITHSSSFSTDTVSQRTDGINIDDTRTDILGEGEDNENSSSSSTINGILNTAHSSSSSSVLISVPDLDAKLVSCCSSLSNKDNILSMKAKRENISRKVSEHKQIAAEVQMTVSSPLSLSTAF